jgi:hypothetical protein
MIRQTIKIDKTVKDIITLAKFLKISPLKINHYTKQSRDYVTVYFNQTI